MRLIRPFCLSVLLLLLAVTPALAEKVETDGFTVKIPPGYRKMLDSEQGSGSFNFPMVDAFMDGDPDMKTFIKGTVEEPLGAIVVIYMPMKGEQTSISDAELGIAGDQLGGMLSQGFSMKKEKFQGEYDGVVITCRLEDIPTAHGVEGAFRMATIACGDYATFVGLVSFQADEASDLDLEWQQLIGSLKIDPPTDWTMILLIVLSFSSTIVFVFRVLLKKPPQISYATDSDSAFQRRDMGVRDMDGLPTYGQPQAQPQTFQHAEATLEPRSESVRPGHELPGSAPLAGASDPAPTPPQQTPSQPAQPPRQPAPAQSPGGPGSGLRSTLPESGRWSDQFKKN